MQQLFGMISSLLLGYVLECYSIKKLNKVKGVLQVQKYELYFSIYMFLIWIKINQNSFRI